MATTKFSEKLTALMVEYLVWWRDKDVDDKEKEDRVEAVQVLNKFLAWEQMRR